MSIETEALEATQARKNYEEVSHPEHYNKYSVEVWDIVEQLNFNLGNVVKYVCRAGHKPNEDILTALHKAENYLSREIKRIEAERRS